MKDGMFIEQIIQKGDQAREKIVSQFSNISEVQLNWKASAQSWSIAQCLEHLIISHDCYFDDLKNITQGSYKMTFWERYSPFTSVCGRIMKDRLQEKVNKKMIAPRKIRPASNSNLKNSIIDNYYQSLGVFLAYISRCKDIDIDKTIINSPLISIVTYSLRDAFQFLIQHEHRHINQAIRVITNQGFPKN